MNSRKTVWALVDNWNVDADKESSIMITEDITAKYVLIRVYTVEGKQILYKEKIDILVEPATLSPLVIEQMYTRLLISIFRSGISHGIVISDALKRATEMLKQGEQDASDTKDTETE